MQFFQGDYGAYFLMDLKHRNQFWIKLAHSKSLKETLNAQWDRTCQPNFSRSIEKEFRKCY